MLAIHMRVFCNFCQIFLKVSFVCRHLHEKFAYTARMLIIVIATSNSKLHHTTILGQWTRVCLLCLYASDLRVMLTQNLYYLIPIVFVTTISNQIKESGDKHVLATLNY